MRNKKINSKIFALWNKHFQDDPDAFAPLFYDEFKKGGLLFVGMNPSFSNRGFNALLRNTTYKDIDPAVFFKWNNIKTNPSLVDDCVKIENHAYANYSFFNRPKEIAKTLDMEWQHIDLFLYRETNQGDFLGRIIDDGNLNKFGLDQLSIFEKTLIHIAPQCIVVANAKASELIQTYKKKNLKYDKKRGFHWFSKDKVRTPIFFSSMLSGQRALDRWSYERLIWHIGQAVK